jgi:hypothetical protein
VPPGPVALAAAKPGWLDGAYGRLRPGGLGQHLVVTASEEDREIPLTLWRPAAMTGTVRDEAGEPLVGVSVRALREAVDGAWPEWAVGSSAITDDRGFFRIDSLSPGTYLLSVPSPLASLPAPATPPTGTVSVGDPSMSRTFARAPDSRFLVEFARLAPPDRSLVIGNAWLSSNLPVVVSSDGRTILAYPTAFYPGVDSADLAARVSLVSGQERSGLEIVVLPAHSHSVSGVVTANGSPVPRAFVELRRNVQGPLLEATAAVAVVDETGGFRFPVVPAGEYTLFAEVPVPPRQAGSGQTGTSQVVVGNDDLRDISMVLSPALLVSGSVESESGERLPREELERLRIEARSLDVTRARSATTAVPEDARFWLTDLAPASYHLRVVLSDAPGWFLESILLDGDDVSDRAVKIDRHLSGVTVRLTREPTRVSGHVRVNGRPDPSASVMAFPADGDPMPALGTRSRRLATVRVDAQGAYEIVGLPRGRYLFAAIPEREVGDGPSEALLRRLATSASVVQVFKGGQSVDLTTTEIAP